MPLDMLVIVFFSTIIALNFALSARMPLFSVPWYSVLLEPHRFGGKRAVLLGVIFLFSWVLAGILICVCFAKLLSNLTTPIDFVYKSFGSSHTPEPGLMTITLISCVYYIYICNATKRLTENLANNPPNQAMFPEQNSGKGGHAILKNMDTPVGLPRFMAFTTVLLPHLLQPLYVYFYGSTGVLIDGLSKKLLDEFGRQNIRRFFAQHRRSSDNYLEREIESIRERFAQEPNSDLETEALLVAKLRRKNYHVTRGYLENYVAHLGTLPTQKEKRSTKRQFLSRPLKGRIRMNGTNKPCRVIEFSQGWAGCFVTTGLPLQEQGSCTLEVEGQVFHGVVMHSDCIHHNRKVYAGYGLSILSMLG